MAQTNPDLFAIAAEFLRERSGYPNAHEDVEIISVQLTAHGTIFTINLTNRGGGALDGRVTTRYVAFDHAGYPLFDLIAGDSNR